MALGRAPTTPKTADLPDQHSEEIERAMNRQAATPKGFERRVQDLELGRVTDPRQSGKVTIPLPTVLVALVASGEPYALLRVHTVAWVSSEAAPCIHLRAYRREHQRDRFHG
jgi:hypothetical protein